MQFLITIAFHVCECVVGAVHCRTPLLRFIMRLRSVAAPKAKVLLYYRKRVKVYSEQNEKRVKFRLRILMSYNFMFREDYKCDGQKYVDASKCTCGLCIVLKNVYFFCKDKFYARPS